MSLIKLALDAIVPNPSFQDTLNKLTNRPSANLNMQILNKANKPIQKIRSIDNGMNFSNQMVETYVDNSIV